jgi:hypothetical protein
LNRMIANTKSELMKNKELREECQWNVDIFIKDRCLNLKPL